MVSEYFSQNNWLSNGVLGWMNKCAGGGSMSARGDTLWLLSGLIEFWSIKFWSAILLFVSSSSLSASWGDSSCLILLAMIYQIFFMMCFVYYVEKSTKQQEQAKTNNNNNNNISNFKFFWNIRQKNFRILF